MVDELSQQELGAAAHDLDRIHGQEAENKESLLVPSAFSPRHKVQGVLLNVVHTL